MASIAPTLDPETYAIERATCDKAHAYAERIMTSGKRRRNYLTAEEVSHPDYAACDNAMRGRVEQYEVLTHKPDVIVAYLGERDVVTTWTGDPLGQAMCMSTWRTPRSYVSSTQSHYHAVIAGRKYHGRSGGEGMAIVLRAMRPAIKGA